MSQTVIAEDTRLRLAQSMPEVERSRAALTRKMQERLQELETPDEAFGQAEVTSMMLVNLMIDCASDVAAFGGLRGLDTVVGEHRRLDIDGRHYSRFGLALPAVLREVLGFRLSPRAASAWCDAFWFIAGQIAAEQGESEPRRAVRGG